MQARPLQAAVLAYDYACARALLAAKVSFSLSHLVCPLKHPKILMQVLPHDFRLILTAGHELCSRESRTRRCTLCLWAEVTARPVLLQLVAKTVV